MRKLLLSLGFLVGLTSLASAQCVGVGGVNNAPFPGMNCAMEPTVDTYGFTAVGIIPAASATDIACLTGSATKVIRVQMIRVSGSGTAISVPVTITKHIVANTGGTSSAPVVYALDSASPAGTATALAYTANPTITAGAGILDNGNLGVVATTVGAAVQPYVLFDYLSRGFSMAPVVRGVAQQICVNLNGTTPTALLNVSMRWTEAAQ